MKLIRRFTVRTVLPPSIAALGTLATNLRWAWHAPTRDLFASIDPGLWRASHEDPIALLGELDTDALAALAADQAFVERVNRAAEDLRLYLTEPRWYQQEAAGRDLPTSIAYLSPEFGLTGALPQYSGGLGILAGDHLKSASDLGAPIVGVGLLYGSGYFKQALDRGGWQAETYPVLDPDGLPLTLLRDDDGVAYTVTINLPAGRKLRARIWKADVGRVPLLLLDSNVPGHDERARSVTDRLYGGGGEKRLLQELLLGMGGIQALRLWSRITGAPAPEVYHINEGHAGFQGVARIAEFVAGGLSYAQALEAVRGATVFTTHTPVPAGIDRFKLAEVREYFSGDQAIKGINVEDVLALGAEDYEGGDPTVFNMAVMGLRLGGRANGVSLLHGEVSRQMFAGLWPGFDASEVPITSVTNGVHAPTWVDRRLAEIAEKRLGGIDTNMDGWLDPSIVSDGELWDILRDLRAQLVEDARNRVRRSWLRRGASPAELGWTEKILDPDVLTIGFARRVPTYKRLTLMLRDPDRLRALLCDPEHAIQIVVAGKSHPADEQGKAMIQDLVRFADAADVRERIVFLPNYDISMAQSLIPGCDVWLNNPLRPLEASGTSGMKAALNGALNLSVLDGWWDEWYDGHNGWAIPTADGVSDPGTRDDIEAAALYDLLEGHVVPLFYSRDERGLPAHWLAMVRHTLATLGPKVQATRMVRDYVNNLYTPAAQLGRQLRADDLAGAKQLAAWKAKVRAAWPEVRVDHVEAGAVGDVVQVGDIVRVRAHVKLGPLTPDDVAVQVVYGRATEADQLDNYALAPLDLAEDGGQGRCVFAGEVALDRSGPFGYTVRIVPKHALLATAADLALVAAA